MANLGDAEGATKRSPLRRLLAVDELGIFVALVVFFIIGADAFAEIRTWYRWEDVVASVEFIAVTRPGHTYLSPPGAKVRRLETVALPVSSSEIRNELARGETPPDLPPPVTEYIRARGLYL